MNEIARQCIAHNRIGERCQKSAMHGQQVCHFHGGKNPDALRKAQERLLALAEPALDGLLKALESNDLPAIVSAARIVLDRAGLGPSASLTVSRVEDSSSWVHWLTTDQLTQVHEWCEEAKRKMLSGAPIEVIPSEVIDVDGLTFSGLSPAEKSRSTQKVISTNNLDEPLEATSGAPGPVETVTETVTAERPSDLTREIT